MPILAVFVVVPAFALPACDSEGNGGQTAGSTAARAAVAPCPPPYLVSVSNSHSHAELERARRGFFDIYGFRTRLDPPIAWAMDPHRSLRFQAYLSNLRFLDVLFYGYRKTGDTDYLRQALGIALDWIDSNPRGVPGGGIGTWSGKVTGDRVPYLAYLTRAARCEGILNAKSQQRLAASLREHADLLVDPASASDTNHDLYVQLGLTLLAQQLPDFPHAQGLRRVATERFRRTLEARLADGIWLEHSSSYQFLAIRVVEDLLRLGGSDDQRLRRDLARMRAAAAWLTMPDGRQTQFGDSRMLPVPELVERRAERDEGLRVFRDAGFAVVRAKGGYLAVAAGFHNTTHKHADELSFELYDEGRRLVTDTGLYEKEPGPTREFVVSPPAHSVLTVDGGDFPIADPREAYGSALTAAGEGDGWYAIEGRNPLLSDLRVRHERLFLYRPGAALVLVDSVRSAERHVYDRYLQLAPGLRLASRTRSRLDLVASGFRGEVYDAAAAQPGRRTTMKDEHHPLAGLTSPDYRVWRPRWTVRLRSRQRDATRATTVAIGPQRLHAVAVRDTGGGFVLRLRDADGPLGTLRVIREGSTLAVAETAAGE